MKNEFVTQTTTDAALDDDYTSDDILTGRSDTMGIQAVFVQANATNPSGTFSIEVSIDGDTYTPISGSSVVVAAPGDIVWSIDSLSYPRVRVKYVDAGSGGDGLLNVFTYRKTN
jgi:hypothetical protein